MPARRQSKSDGGESSRGAADASTGAAAQPAELQLIRDLSQARVGFLHYLAMFLWLGWFLFYFSLPAILVALYFHSMAAFTAMLGLIATSALYPIKWKLQPKTGFALGRFIVRHAAEYLRVR